MAAWAAALIAAGVAKSGSPAPKSMTSTPSRRSRSTVAVTFIVGELAIRLVLSAKRGMNSLSSGRTGPPPGSLPAFSLDARDALPAQPFLDQIWHQTVNLPAE